jgi:hypothetical protein
MRGDAPGYGADLEIPAKKYSWISGNIDLETRILQKINPPKTTIREKEF